jgi:hypothetical protein
VSTSLQDDTALRARLAAAEAERDKYRHAALSLWTLAKFAHAAGVVDLMPSAQRCYAKNAWLDEEVRTWKP